MATNPNNDRTDDSHLRRDQRWSPYQDDGRRDRDRERLATDRDRSEADDRYRQRYTGADDDRGRTADRDDDRYRQRYTGADDYRPRYGADDDRDRWQSSPDRSAWDRGQQGGFDGGYGARQGYGDQGYSSFEGRGVERSGYSGGVSYGQRDRWRNDPRMSSMGSGSYGGRDEGGFGARRMGEHRGKGPSGYQRPDERIREQVCDALTYDEHVDASSIEVQVKNGEVTLTGHIPERQMKRAAEECVEHIAGVKDVTNSLRVQDAGREAQGNGRTHAATGSSTGSDKDADHAKRPRA